MLLSLLLDFQHSQAPQKYISVLFISTKYELPAFYFLHRPDASLSYNLSLALDVRTVHLYFVKILIRLHVLVIAKL